MEESMGKKGQNERANVNQGPAPKPTAEEHAREFDIARNARIEGEDPSPDDRNRGEVSTAEPPTPVDVDR
jgi:hypothetical protein